MKTRNTRNAIAVLAMLGLCIAAGPSDAATIAWTTYDITNNVANVSTNGTLVDARTGRLGVGNNVTVNGVTFKSVENSGNLFDSLFANDNIGARGYGSVVTDASYRTFLQFGQRSGRSGSNTPPQIAPTQVWATVNFSGLTVGRTYEIQIWASDVSVVGAASLTDGVSKNSVLLLGDGSAGSPVYGTDAQLFFEASDPGTSNLGGAGQYGIGTFVADATTQSFNVRTYRNIVVGTPGYTNSDHFSNGWQLRDLGVVEVVPSPAALPAGLAMLGLVAMRRRRTS